MVTPALVKPRLDTLPACGLIHNTTRSVYLRRIIVAPVTDTRPLQIMADDVIVIVNLLIAGNMVQSGHVIFVASVVNTSPAFRLKHSAPSLPKPRESVNQLNLPFELGTPKAKAC